MEIQLTPELEAQLADIAKHEGLTTAELIVNAALSLTERDRRIMDGVQRGLAQAARGEFIEEDEMDRRFEKMLNP